MEVFRGLRSQYTEALTSGGYVLLFVLAFASSAKSSQLNPIYFVLLAGAGFVSWLATFKRAQAIAQLPTSRVGSAAQGYVELYGRASLEKDFINVAPHSGKQCLWYRYRIYERDDKTWREIDHAVSSATFEINDATGVCRVDPDDAEVLGADQHTSYRDGYKHVEELLFGGGKIYVLGEFSTLNAAPNAVSLSEDVSHLLSDWKKDPIQLRKRFDLNHDGQIDLQEWELARKLALHAVEKEHAQLRQTAHVNMMRAPKNSRLFLISSLSPQKLRQRYVLWSCVHLAVFVFASVAAFWAL
jgi:hypothetical protein